MEYALDRQDVRPLWKAFTEHEFVDCLGKGTLPLENFKWYLVQDYLYLVCEPPPKIIVLTISNTYPKPKVHFARSNALAAYKSADMDSIAAVGSVLHYF